MNFEESHAAFIDDHLERRSGERKGRLARGHQHGEQLFLRNVWWPLQGNLVDLHPEYEVLDWRGRSYFADFAWLSGLVKLLIEIKGFATHVRDMDRQKHSNEVNRETFLHAMGYQLSWRRKKSSGSESGWLNRFDQRMWSFIWTSIIRQRF